MYIQKPLEFFKEFNYRNLCYSVLNSNDYAQMVLSVLECGPNAKKEYSNVKKHFIYIMEHLFNKEMTTNDRINSKLHDILVSLSAVFKDINFLHDEWINGAVKDVLECFSLKSATGEYYENSFILLFNLLKANLSSKIKLSVKVLEGVCEDEEIFMQTIIDMLKDSKDLICNVTGYLFWAKVNIEVKKEKINSEWINILFSEDYIQKLSKVIKKNRNCLCFDIIIIPILNAFCDVLTQAKSNEDLLEIIWPKLIQCNKKFKELINQFNGSKVQGVQDLYNELCSSYEQLSKKELSVGVNAVNKA